MIEIMSAAAALFADPDRQLTLAPGTFLFCRGARIREVFLVQAGAVQLARHHTDGRVLVQQRAGPGQVIAEASLFSARYHCDAIATAPSRVLAFDRARLRARLADDGAFAQAWLQHLALEVQRARLRSEVLSLRTVGERLDAWLQALGAAPARGGWKAVAEQIAVSPEALYRELARRCREG